MDMGQSRSQDGWSFPYCYSSPPQFVVVITIWHQPVVLIGVVSIFPSLSFEAVNWLWRANDNGNTQMLHINNLKNKYSTCNIFLGSENKETKLFK